MYNLFEDEDDIFQGSPRSKFMDIVYTANRELVQVELERLFDRMAAMEILLQEQFGEDGIDIQVKKVQFERGEEVDYMKKSLFIESTGNVIVNSAE